MQLSVKVLGRNSPLSKLQIKEVEEELRSFVPDIKFEVTTLESHGDKNKHISLRTLDKTNFFTKEIDELLLKGEGRIAIHSAKDLPEPLPKGLKMVALTKGVDSSDSLVLREGDCLKTLKSGATIATSSVRREEMVKALREDLTFVDTRGTIGERLDKLFEKEVDGVVIAQAALIRLGLTHLNLQTLPGETTPLQGRLAIVAREDDHEMETLFAYIYYS